MAANEIILRRTLKEELIAERQAPMGGRRERAGGNLGFRVSGLPHTTLYYNVAYILRYSIYNDILVQA